MRNFIAPFGLLVVLAVVIFVVTGIQWGVYSAVQRTSEVASNVTCTVKSFDEQNERGVLLKLDCNGHKAETSSVPAIVSYVQNPGPLKCTLYRSGYADCKPRRRGPASAH